MRKLILSVILSFSFIICESKTDGGSYPQGYFRNPLDIPILLAGNFGECRPNHFHSGIDIKTGGKENLPVYAAAEGYVSRIKMEKGGFGHALYVTHPEGYTTLYAHLNNFIPALQDYLKKAQYEKESWAMDIALKPEQFPVRKGEQIAWSGNTGASTAPHLHFEIRDTKTEHPLNPLLFGLPVSDDKAPVPVQLAFYDLNQSIYEQQPRIVALKGKTNSYSVSGDTVLLNTDKLGIGLNADDFMNGSSNTLNFYTASWYVDNVVKGTILLDDIGYDVTRYLHAYIDYKTKKEKKSWFQLLFQLPGNMLDHIYSATDADRGAIRLADSLPHEVRIVLKDAAGNVTSISFYMRSRGTSAKQDCKNLFLVNETNKLESANIRFTLDKTSLYDNVCFNLARRNDENSLSDRFELEDSRVPVHNYFDLSIKPNKPVAFALRDKVVLMYSDGKDESGKAAKPENGWYSAPVRAFGTYWLQVDTSAPVITAVQKQGANLSKSARLSFSVKEAMTSVKTFRALLNGKWLCFEPRGELFFYTFDEHCPRGKHKLEITASDESNNQSRFVFTFVR